MKGNKFKNIIFAAVLIMFCHITAFSQLTSDISMEGHLNITRLDGNFWITDPNVSPPPGVIGPVTIGIASEVGGQLLDYGCNYQQLFDNEPGRTNSSIAGGFFRIDLRPAYDKEFFNVKWIPPGGVQADELTVYSVSTSGAMSMLGGVTATMITIESNVNAVGSLELNAGAGNEMIFNDSAAGTISLQNLAGWHGSVTRIKILPSDFMSNDDDNYGDIMYENDLTGKGVRVGNANCELFAFVSIPTGYKATHVMIYGNSTDIVTVYETDIVDGEWGTDLGSASTGTEIDITDVNSNTTNFLTIYINVNSNADIIYGGYVTIEKI